MPTDDAAHESRADDVRRGTGADDGRRAVPADATMREVEAVMEAKYGAGQRAWFGHPARITVKGQPIEFTPHDEPRAAASPRTR